ncbi:hypothetical protein PC114_g14753 [Phytophthora cactorum]|uniref:PiggyBac transposable element-derived protein domain-containing protein n=1 Tax=Phytophthora cactorum TaxID=29920 RepID=A0A8T1CTB4_9STRA|nr:hypothetical protein PC114_g14753 [Phytophthora cactorum]KAG2928797.1 hypothetical protein PC117_g14191 [Phytophthora cactorum]KAG4051357.1 hypothetical protein PC123_g13430 [Phytophthora cactorum]
MFSVVNYVAFYLTFIVTWLSDNRDEGCTPLPWFGSHRSTDVSTKAATEFATCVDAVQTAASMGRLDILKFFEEVKIPARGKAMRDEINTDRGHVARWDVEIWYRPLTTSSMKSFGGYIGALELLEP